ncbi:MAG: hypothetical protein KDD70_03160 [Bdellovibrionales bacterium]|nr:hypothetical protein [Bdellovibrionales bacterium]
MLSNPFSPNRTRGVEQVSLYWMRSDGTQEQRQQFCEDYYCRDAQSQREHFSRISKRLHEARAAFLKLERAYRLPLETSHAEFLAIDRLFAGYRLGVHLVEDLYVSKVAFAVLLNFPLFSLEEKLKFGSGWSSEEWARCRLADMVSVRIPRALLQSRLHQAVRAEEFVESLTVSGKLFSEDDGSPVATGKLRAHWDLRDQIIRGFRIGRGRATQAQLFTALELFAIGDLPHKSAKELLRKAENSPKGSHQATLTKRYKPLERVLRAEHIMAEHTLPAVSMLEREFEFRQEISISRLEKIALDILESPLCFRVADALSRRIGRSLEPYDLWNTAFRQRPALSALAPRITNRDVMSFGDNIEGLLTNLSFDDELARTLASKIVLQQGRADAHAVPGGGDPSKMYLRLPKTEDGTLTQQMSYDLLHELGHCVEYLISQDSVEYEPLRGSPNTSISEAFAFQFEQRALVALLGDSQELSYSISPLASFWECYESAGVALLELEVYRSIPRERAPSAELLGELFTVKAQEIWNKYYAPILGRENSPILACYTHLLYTPLYVPHYLIGQLLSFLIDSHLEGKDFGHELERMSSIGKLPFLIWVQKAIGAEFNPDPLFLEVDRVLSRFDI